MKDNLRVAAASLNQTPMDWDRNKRNMQKAINEAASQDVHLLVFPELCTTGYGCEDAFLMQGIDEVAMEILLDLHVPEHLTVIAGLPIRIQNRLYNGAALLIGNKLNKPTLQGVYLKQNLAKNGIHYETRWFNPWPKGVKEEIEGPHLKAVPVGDIVFSVNGVRIGFEICEDAWVAERPGLSLFDRGVDIIVNPSASHFAIGKHRVREQLVVEGTRAFGAAYIYANLNGCEAGRAIFDGGNLIASGGQVKARGSRLFYAPVDLVVADIDLWENRLVQQSSSQAPKNGALVDSVVQAGNPYWKNPTARPHVKEGQPWQELQGTRLENEEAVRAIALGLHDWLAKTNTNGFALSLSGGADSALVASEVALMVRYAIEDYLAGNKESLDGLEKFLPEKPVKYFLKDRETREALAKEITAKLLTTVYQESKNSGHVTKNAAKALADSIGANHHEWAIDVAVEFYTGCAEEALGRQLTWDSDDIALQNIQARSRAPGIWMMANVNNQLLLTTGNLSESAVGYMTQDGDTAGVLAPIIGVRKTRVRRLLRWLHDEGTLMVVKSTEQLGGLDSETLRIRGLSYVIDQQPTAELRPDEQTDEEDLMPFEVLDAIITESLVLRRNPKGLYKAIKRQFPEIPGKVVVEHLDRYYGLFTRNQWKRDRGAPGFHIEMDSLDPKTFARFPLLSGGMRREVQELRSLLINEVN